MAGLYNKLISKVADRDVANEDFVNCPNWLMINYRIEDGPWFDQLIEMKDKTWRGFLRLIFQIRRHKGQLAVVLPNTFRSALLARLGGVRRVYGYRRNSRTALLTDGPLPLREGGQRGSPSAKAR